MNPSVSSSRVPLVRHFIACERVDRSADGRQCSLVNLVHAIQPAPGAPYPRIHPELYLFAQITDGQGQHLFQIQLVLVEGEETLIRTTPPISRDLGHDPLIVHGWPIHLRNILFPQAGLYEFRLFCDGQEIAREPILLRPTP
jgi:hypothetical protein